MPQIESDSLEKQFSALEIESPPNINISEELPLEWNRLTSNDADRAVELVKQVWKDHAEFDPSFFNLFDSKTVKTIIRRVTINVIDHMSRQPIAANGNSLLITGIRGVGKTTLMRGLWSVLSNLQENNLVAIYHDFEKMEAYLLSELLLDSFCTSKDRQLPQTVDSNDHFEDLLSKLHAAGFRVVMFLDEIQNLFVKGNNVNYQKYLKITKEILTLGKSQYHCFGVVSGSSSNMRNLAYKKDPIAEDGNYPNLNNNVYLEYKMDSVRSREELRNILSADRTDRCFQKTGGVGRSIHTYILDPESYSIPN
eukprot:gb/GECH01002307.1/.p1 GENE.gb/GECH01002307.1/~~gb/GECH01002307.1/.p1  ORF type:complete len:309 (+),score=35.08 gb/GECH01002307.1/:1-927(+)